MKTIPLTRGAVALVDDEDYERLARFKWRVSHGYAARAVYNPDGSRAGDVFMHLEICPAPEGMEVDHKNRNRLDNQRHNLRPATHAQNCRNQGLRRTSTTGFKGVSFFKRDGTYRAYIVLNYKQKHLGYFGTPEEAKAAYDAAARELHGEFACL